MLHQLQQSSSTAGDFKCSCVIWTFLGTTEFWWTFMWIHIRVINSDAVHTGIVHKTFRYPKSDGEVMDFQFRIHRKIDQNSCKNSFLISFVKNKMKIRWLHKNFHWIHQPICLEEPLIPLNYRLHARSSQLSLVCLYHTTRPPTWTWI